MLTAWDIRFLRRRSVFHVLQATLINWYSYSFSKQMIILYHSTDNSTTNKEKKMKRLVLLILFLLFVSAGSVYADVYMTKQAGDYTVTARFEKTPPVVGENYLTINIEDGAKNPVTDAKVSIKYYVTAQRQSTQMPYMESNTVAELNGSGYRAILNLPVKGPWYIVVRLVRGSREESVTFHFHLEP
jgi:YtkA-like